jgi:nitrate reductase gamma subunit
MLIFLKWGAAAAFGLMAVSMAVLIRKTLSFGRREFYAGANGSVKRGIAYAFGRGMMPWEKESAGKHLPSYIAGILYHTGIFAAFFLLFFLLIGIPLPRFLLILVRLGLAAGAVCGLGLLLKRLFSPHLRAVSCADDFAANLVVDAFVTLALLYTFGAVSAALLLAASILVLLYIPVGKLRHCVFFFYVRLLFGLFYGRRSVFPPASHKA